MVGLCSSAMPQAGFPRRDLACHPTRKDCINSSDNLPGVPDSVFLGINRDLTVKEFHALRKIGIGGAVIFASGFNEEKDGAALALKLDHAAGEYLNGPTVMDLPIFSTVWLSGLIRLHVNL
ncbi:MAG: hypothetical protein Ct9H300mP28_22400 [Pseudomonadota bacterium]|nr:MAG: hypothetical protein Ct9H300mP28_22400 [Pseudomonadota bacterium]